MGEKTDSAGSGFSGRAPQGFAITNQSDDHLYHAGLSRYPLLQQTLKALHIQLGQQHPPPRKADPPAHAAIGKRLEKLIRSVAAAWIWNGKANPMKEFPAQSSTKWRRLSRATGTDF